MRDLTVESYWLRIRLAKSDRQSDVYALWREDSSGFLWRMTDWLADFFPSLTMFSFSYLFHRTDPVSMLGFFFPSAYLSPKRGELMVFGAVLTETKVRKGPTSEADGEKTDDL